MYITFYIGYFDSNKWWSVDSRLEPRYLIIVKRVC